MQAEDCYSYAINVSGMWVGRVVRGAVDVTKNMAHGPLVHLTRPMAITLSTKRRVTIIKPGKNKGDLLISALLKGCPLGRKDLICSFSPSIAGAMCSGMGCVTFHSACKTTSTGCCCRRH